MKLFVITKHEVRPLQNSIDMDGDFSASNTINNNIKYNIGVRVVLFWWTIRVNGGRYIFILMRIRRLLGLIFKLSI